MYLPMEGNYVKTDGMLHSYRNITTSYKTTSNTIRNILVYNNSIISQGLYTLHTFRKGLYIYMRPYVM
jgi:hypothetical protein